MSIRINNSILNNLKDHVDSGDVLFVVSGETFKNSQVAEALNKRCSSKCPGRRKLNRNLHSKVVDASEFVACYECSGKENCKTNDEMPLKKNSSEMLLSKSPVNNLKEKTLNRIKSQGAPTVDRNRKRAIIMRQMKNHRISSTLSMMSDLSRPTNL